MILNKLRSATAAFAILAAGLASTAMAEKWDMPTAYPDNSYMTENLRDFADAVRIATGGEIDIVIHPSGSLFPGNEIKRAVQTGQVQIGERIISAHANENAVFGVDSVPFLAPSFEDSVTLWDASRPVLSEILAEQNLVVLFSVPWPAQGLYSKKELTSIDDLKGMKVRGYNAGILHMAELAGAQGVQVEYAELTQALSTGVADATVGSGSSGVEKKLWEVLKYYYELNMWLPRNLVVVNKDVWDGRRAPQSVDRALAEFDRSAFRAQLGRGHGLYHQQRRGVRGI
ncbi:TRAP transporter substrate-binding protein [Microbulbifer sp. S227A]|uniref:TRAP transporter substrate-binding protein n=1 Tax=Microbulbifer sp. S227A TaxID=3415131 RepID=UPI003C7DD802